jgi:hypothetical protein
VLDAAALAPLAAPREAPGALVLTPLPLGGARGAALVLDVAALAPLAAPREAPGALVLDAAALGRSRGRERPSLLRSAHSRAAKVLA